MKFSGLFKLHRADFWKSDAFSFNTNYLTYSSIRLTMIFLWFKFLDSLCRALRNFDRQYPNFLKIVAKQLNQPHSAKKFLFSVESTLNLFEYSWQIFYLFPNILCEQQENDYTQNDNNREFCLKVFFESYSDTIEICSLLCIPNCGSTSISRWIWSGITSIPIISIWFSWQISVINSFNLFSTSPTKTFLLYFGHHTT